MSALAALAPLAAIAVPLVAKIAGEGVKIASQLAKQALEFTQQTDSKNNQIKF